MATNYFWDEIEDNVVEEYDGDTGNTIVSYTTEPTLYGSVHSQDRSGEVRHFQFDGLGNTMELTDEFGDVTDTRRYAAFGEASHSTGRTELSFAYVGSREACTDKDVHLILGRERVYSSHRGQGMQVSYQEHNRTGRSPESPGTFALMSSACGPDFKGCCCRTYHPTYYPSSSDLAAYSWICMMQYVVTSQKYECGKWNNNKWHYDEPLDEQLCAQGVLAGPKPPKPYKMSRAAKHSINLSDFPGIDTPYCEWHYVPVLGSQASRCPSCRSLVSQHQSFEACAVGGLPNGTQVILGCIRFALHCDWTWRITQEVEFGFEFFETGGMCGKRECCPECSAHYNEAESILYGTPPRQQWKGLAFENNNIAANTLVDLIYL